MGVSKMSSDLPRVLLVGAGALGSHVALFGRGLPVRWTVVDHDRIEAKNLLSQFHTRPNLGRNKAVSLKQTLFVLFSTSVEGIPHQLVDANAEALLSNQDLIIDCVDNRETRRILQAWTRAHPKVSCIHGAVSNDGKTGQATWDEDFTIDPGPTPPGATCVDGAHLPFLASVAAEIVFAVQLFLETGAKRSTIVMPGARLQLSLRMPTL